MYFKQNTSVDKFCSSLYFVNSVVYRVCIGYLFLPLFFFFFGYFGKEYMLLRLVLGLVQGLHFALKIFLVTKPTRVWSNILQRVSIWLFFSFCLDLVLSLESLILGYIWLSTCSFCCSHKFTFQFRDRATLLESF